MNKKFALAVKYTLDLVVALTMLIVCLPLMVPIALAVKLSSPGSIFFRQQRAGLHGQAFWLLKFRSMVTDADRNGPVTLLEDSRVTRVGRFLRLSSLDELPQLINVVRGEMSLVGPRALLPESIKPDEARRQTMKPGCTSLPIVSGRQSLEWDERMRLDLWYVDNWNLWLDLQILAKTIPVVLLRQNVYDSQGQMKTRPESFSGSTSKKAGIQ